jgi:acetyltransferase-like isoleucine patch superfamily enzyme/coenzyme F420-reducing hydrogenase beta subunit
MINITEKKDCCGCNACGDICSQQAITFKTDTEGFWYPEIDTEKCTKCGLCENVCPVLHPKDGCPNAFDKPIVYAANHKNADVRKASTSGGLFTALADQMYAEGGAVGGAVWTNDFRARHIISANPDDLAKIRGTKYQQSDLDGFYRQVNEQLKLGKKALVCAMPCQIAGLQNYFKKKLDDIIFVDTICLGLDSPLVFQKYLRSLENKYGGKVVKVRAKSKDKGWRRLAYKIEFDNGKVYLSNGLENDYIRGTIRTHAYCRTSCYGCKFKGLPRIADITLGDFWGIENTDSKLDDNLGTSCVLINTEKGSVFFEKCRDNLDIEERTFEEVEPGNRALLFKAPRYPQRNIFFEYLKEHSFEEAAQKFFPYQKMTSKVLTLLRSIPRTPTVMFQIFSLNTFSGILKNKLFVPDTHCAFDIHKTAKIILDGRCRFGIKKNRKSKLESALLLEKNSELHIGNSVTITAGADIQVFKNAKLHIGNNVMMNRNIQIICMESIAIGNDVGLARDVVIRDNDGGHKISLPGYKDAKPIKIGNHVRIGQGAIVMKGADIGDGAIIGAHAVVMGKINPGSLVMGEPTRTLLKGVSWKH